MFQEIIKYIQDHYKTKEFIPLHSPLFVGNEINYLKNCIETTFVSSVGKFVDDFELAISQLTNTSKTVAVVNGTSALHISLKLAGVSQNDEVITQALTFVATVNAIKYLNAHPVFLDVDIDTMGLSPKSIEEFLIQYGEIREDGCYNKLTNRKIAACLPMHTFGFPVHIIEIIKICKKWNIPVVEDCAEALGSEYNNKAVGGFGLFGAFSFNGNKIITTGGGGAITTNNNELAKKAKHITTTAKVNHPYEFHHDDIGYNYRMPNINAALGLAQIEILKKIICTKRNFAKKHEIFFKEKGINFRKEIKNTRANYWLMSLQLNSKTERDLFLKETNNAGVMTRPIWDLMYNLSMYKNCHKDHQTNTKFLSERIVNFPSGVYF